MPCCPICPLLNSWCFKMPSFLTDTHLLISSVSSLTGMEYFNGGRPKYDNSTSEELEGVFWYLLPTVSCVPLLGIPTNWLVIHLLLGKRGVCSTPELFTLQLACFDMLFCFLLIIEYIAFAYSKRAKDAYFVAWGLNETGGPLLLCLLSLDSYVAVCHPLAFHHLKDGRIRLSLCLLVCVLTGGSCFTMKATNLHKWNIIVGLLFTAILIISICTIRTLKFLRKSGPGRKEVHPMKRRASKLVLASYVLINIHYIPLFIEDVIRRYGPEYFRPFSVLSGVSCGFLSWASFTRPLSYLVRTKQLPKNRFHCDSGGKAKDNGQSDNPHG